MSRVRDPLLLSPVPIPFSSIFLSVTSAHGIQVIELLRLEWLPAKKLRVRSYRLCVRIVSASLALVAGSFGNYHLYDRYRYGSSRLG